MLSSHSPHTFRQNPLQWLRWRVGQMQRPWLLLALLCGILLPLGLSAGLAEDVWQHEELHYDAPILWWMHAHASPLNNHIFMFLTEAGGFIGTTLIAFVVAVWLWRHERRRAMLFWLLSVLGAGIANVIIKLFFHRPRPALWNSISPETDSSFPSGHSMLSMSVGLALLLLLWSTKWRVPAIVFAIAWPIAVGISRLYLGVHYPSDVFVGWCAGVAWTSGVYSILRGERHEDFSRELQKEAHADEAKSNATNR